MRHFARPHSRRKNLAYLLIAAMCYDFAAGVSPVSAADGQTSMLEIARAFASHSETLQGVKGSLRLIDVSVLDGPPKVIDFLRWDTAGLTPGLCRTPVGRMLLKWNVSFIVQGSRRFREPAGDGAFLRDFVTVIRLEEDHALFRGLIEGGTTRSVGGMRSESVGEYRVMALDCDVNIHKVTYLFHQLNSRTVILASDRAYLREVLASLSVRDTAGHVDATAPGWKLIDDKADFWAVRCYGSKDAEQDPTSPLASKETVSNVRDPHARSFACSFSSTTHLFDVAYETRQPHASPLLRELLQLDEDTPVQETRDGTGIAKGRVRLLTVDGEREGPAAVMFLIVLGALGHGVSL